MFYKVTNIDGTPCNNGKGQWSLPTQNQDGAWTPGEWMPAIMGELVPCERGYHLCEDAQVLEWLGSALHEAEYRGERINADDKIVVREARLLRTFTAWTPRVQRLLACDYVEHVVHIYESKCPGDNRVRDCIETARRYANGLATDVEMAAAGHAAGHAAWAVAWNAAWDAARAAAGHAALAAAGHAERQWQYERLVWALNWGYVQ